MSFKPVNRRVRSSYSSPNTIDRSYDIGVIIYVRIAKAHCVERGNARIVSVSGHQALTSLAKSRKILNKFVAFFALPSVKDIVYIAQSSSYQN